MERYYTGPMTSLAASGMLDCDAEGPLVVHLVKLYPTADAGAFHALGRVMSGTLRKGQRVRVLGEAYTPDDEEDAGEAEVTHLWLGEARYRIPVTGVPAGNWALLGGVDGPMTKTATLVHTHADLVALKKTLKRPVHDDDDDDVHVFRKLRHDAMPVLKAAIEPVNPAELPKMLDGLRKVNKSYPVVSTRVRCPHWRL